MSLDLRTAGGMPRMTCGELLGFLCDYLLGRLAPHQSAAFEAHLDHCPGCVAFINDIDAVVRLGRCAASGELLPAEVPLKLVVAVHEARAAPPRHPGETPSRS